MTMLHQDLSLIFWLVASAYLLFYLKFEIGISFEANPVPLREFWNRLGKAWKSK
jgi:hypothetical protein